MQDSIMFVIGLMIIFGIMIPSSIVLWTVALDEIAKRRSSK